MSVDRYSRQSFLGPDSEALISRCTIGVPGLGGGGSHVIQQLAHVGFQQQGGISLALRLSGLPRKYGN